MSDTNETRITIRTRLAMQILLIMLKMVQPFKYEHEFNNAIKPIEEILKEKS